MFFVLCKFGDLVYGNLLDRFRFAVKIVDDHTARDRFMTDAGEPGEGFVDLRLIVGNDTHESLQDLRSTPIHN